MDKDIPRIKSVIMTFKYTNIKPRIRTVRIDEEAYNYIKVLEGYIKHPKISKLPEVYPHLLINNKVEDYIIIDELNNKGE